MMIQLGLREIPNYVEGTACVPTAISAITGLTPQEVANCISSVACVRAAPAIVVADPTSPFNINHWLPALVEMGLRWREGKGWHETPVNQRIPMRSFLQEYVADEGDSRVLLIFAERDASDKEPMTHLFAIQGNEIVDTSTYGKKLPLAHAVITDEFNEFRLKRIFEITQ